MFYSRKAAEPSTVGFLLALSITWEVEDQIQVPVPLVPFHSTPFHLTPPILSHSTPFLSVYAIPSTSFI